MSSFGDLFLVKCLQVFYCFKMCHVCVLTWNGQADRVIPKIFTIQPYNLPTTHFGEGHMRPTKLPNQSEVKYFPNEQATYSYKNKKHQGNNDITFFKITRETINEITENFIPKQQ
jgi:hypothetical protein